MNLKHSSYGQKTLAMALPFWAIIVTFGWLGLSGCAKAKKPATTMAEAATNAESSVVIAHDSETSESETSEEEFDEAEFQKFEHFDPDNFDNPTNIDNEWWPLKPRTQFIYEGHTVEEGEEIPHRIVFTVTDLTKEINGVRTVVIYDRDYTDDRMEESELAFFAQDNDGNVWHFGQYREVYDEVEFVGGRMWVVGHLEDAKAGIMMKAEPQLGTPSYSQGYAPPPFNWTDRARTYQMGQTTKTLSGSYEDVLVAEEYNAEEPSAFQLKYYARGVGNVRIGWKGDDTSQEEMELVKIVHLSPEALADVRAEALKLEERAYVYGTTPPAEQMPGADAQ